MLTEKETYERTKHVPHEHRGAVSSDLISEQSEGLPAALRTKIAKAKQAQRDAFAEIDPLTGGGVREYIDKRHAHAELLDEASEWLDANAADEAEACRDRAAAKEERLREVCAEADVLRDEIATERGRAAILSDKNP